MSLSTVMVCIAGMLNAPVPPAVPEVLVIDHAAMQTMVSAVNRHRARAMLVGDTIFVTENIHKPDHIVHELAHWVVAHDPNGIKDWREENTARWVTRHFEVECGTDLVISLTKVH